MVSLGIIFRPQVDPARLREVAVAADRSGVDELWLWEDCFDHGGISLASAALAWTSRLQVGIGVLPVPLRNPALAAMEIASLCHLFPQRLHVGLGHGVLDWMGQVGARVESPMTLLREYVTAVGALLDGATVTTDGRYVRLDDVTLGWPPRPRPALHVAGIRPKTLALAGEVADGLVLTAGTSVEDLRSARAVFDAARGDRPGRGRVTVYLLTMIGPDAEQRRAAELVRGNYPPGADIAVAGDADAIAAGVQRWAEAGADAVILQPARDEDLVAFARFAGEQVRPRLG
jgi:alkanesulfonate monooxygenase SsuD/methylene tetrahydromethanopterin reductase-like flavin-dependent oxidoreductase (luciferase family)